MICHLEMELDPEEWDRRPGEELVTVLVLASQASPTLYLEEDGLVLVLVGEGHMDIPT